MRSTEEAAADEMCCANCGQAEIDDVKLLMCHDCDLVKYCSDACQGNHRPHHEEQCMSRVAELRDKLLFTMPDESHLGECPICCLPLPINLKNVFMGCCSKMICKGCSYTNQIREYKAGLRQRCAFCREPASKSEEEADKLCMRRIKENNCPAAMSQMGKIHIEEGDYGTALEYFTKAAEMGDADAHCELSVMYHEGKGVEKDKEKKVYHSEEAAIGGHPKARHNLGYIEAMDGRYERAVKHLDIAANLGDHESLKLLRQLYADGHASKEDYATALRGYQAAVDATKSPEREEVEETMRGDFLPIG